jgi:sensor histidine kinase regulating citrate/malate metabolism
MKKQSAVGLFFSMFLRAVVIILAIVIVVFGAMFIKKVMDNSESSSKEPVTTVSNNVLSDPEVKDDLLTAEPTEEAEAESTEAAEENSFDKNILVLNSTDVSGLAGRWCEKLNGYGYANTTASDYSEALETTKIVSVTDGVGQDLLNYFNGASYEVGTVSSGTSVSTDGYDIVIIIGTADNDQ